MFFNFLLDKIRTIDHRDLSKILIYLLYMDEGEGGLQLKRHLTKGSKSAYVTVDETVAKTTIKKDTGNPRG